MATQEKVVKVVFPLDVDEDGFPPLSAESLNAWEA